MSRIVGNRGKHWLRRPRAVPASVVCALLVAACAGSGVSYQAAAIEASQRGDQETAISLAQKEVARFSAPDQCSPKTTYNCGTLALAYGSLAEYQILNGEMVSWEISFSRAKEALARTDRESRASATGIVYRDISDALWKIGDRARAVAIFKEGRASGGDSYLFMSSAAAAAEPAPKANSPEPGPAADPAPNRTASKS